MAIPMDITPNCTPKSLSKIEPIFFSQRQVACKPMPHHNTIFKAETAGSKDVAGDLRHLHYPKVLERVETS